MIDRWDFVFLVLLGIVCGIAGAAIASTFIHQPSPAQVYHNYGLLDPCGTKR